MRLLINKVDESKISINLLAIQAIWLVVALLPNLSFQLRLVILLGFTFFSSWLLERKNFKENFFVFSCIFVGLAVFVRVLFQLLSLIPSYVMQFLTLGIDNDPHIQMFKERELVDGQITFVSYQAGQQTIWYLFAKMGGISFETPTKIIAAYGSMYLFTIVALGFCSWRIIRKLNTDKQEEVLKTYFFLLIFLFGSFSYMIVGGYPHYMWGLLVVLMLVNVVLHNQNVVKNLLAASLASWILYQTCQPFVLVTGVFSALIIVKNLGPLKSERHDENSKLRTVLIFIPVLGIAILGLYWLTQVDVGGVIVEKAAIEPISLIQFALTIMISLFLLRKYSTNLNGSVRLVTYLMTLLGFAMAAYTLIAGDGITYYAVKQLQFSFIFLVLISISIFSFKQSTNLIRLLVAIFLLSQFIPTFQPKVFSGPLMGSGHQALALFTQPKMWEVVSIDSKKLIRDANSVELAGNECAIYWKPERILISQSTWLNAIHPRGKNECFDYSYLSNSSNEDEIRKVLSTSDQRFVILYSSKNPPEFEKFVSEKVRFIEMVDFQAT